jgi:hypothetical protein
MATSQDQTVKGVQDIMANVQAAYVSLERGRASLSALINSGMATCQDIKVYNLQVRSVWAYQSSVAGIIRAQGGQAPVIPAPYYVGWRGVPGDRFADVDCSSAQFAGVGAPPAGATRVDPQNVEWRQEVIPGDQAFVTNLINQAGAAAVTAGQQAGLGNPLLAAVPLIIVGVLVAVALVIILKIAEVFMDIPGKKEVTKQIAAQTTAHNAVMEKRTSCYQSCVATGKDATECARNCARLYPDFVAKYPGGGLGIVGTIAGVAVLGLAIYAGYRYVASRPVGGGGRRARALPAAGDDYDEAEGIDVGPGMKIFKAA